MRMELLRRLVEIDQERKNLAAQDKALSKEREALDDQIQEMYAEEGLTSVRVGDNPVGTVTRTFCRVRSGLAGTPELMEVFRRYKLEYLIKPQVHAGSLTSAITEMLEHGEELAEDLRDVLMMGEKTRMQVYGLKAKGE